MFSGKRGQLKSITGGFTSCTSNRMMTSHDGSLLQIMESCLVCRAVISTSKRRRLCSEASCYVLPLLKEWLEQLPESPVACLKCFGMLERVIRLRRSTKEIEEVLKSHLAQGALTFTDGTIVCSVSTQTVEFEELSVSLQSSTTPISRKRSWEGDSTRTPNTPKRRCTDPGWNNLPTPNNSPSVAVSNLVLIIHMHILIESTNPIHSPI